MKARVLERAENVSNYLKQHEPAVKIFSDEKIFTIDPVLNQRNNAKAMYQTPSSNHGFWSCGF